MGSLGNSTRSWRFSANLTGQTGSHMTDPLREWNITEKINKNHIAQNSGVIFSGRGNCTSYSKQSRVWWWQPEALGAGETEKGSSMDAVGECPEWRQPADPRTHQEVSIISWFEYGPGGILSIWGIWSGSWIVQLPCIVDQPSFTWKFAVWHFVVVFLHCTTWGAWGTIRSHQRTWQKDYNVWYALCVGHSFTPSL